MSSSSDRDTVVRLEHLVEQLGKKLEGFDKIALRMEAATAQKPGLLPKPTGAARGGAGTSAPTGSSDVPVHVRAYDDAVAEVLSRFSALSEKIGGDCAEGSKRFRACFEEQRNLLWKAAGQSEPAQAALMKFLEPLVTKLNDIGQFKDSKRTSPHVNHLSALAEGAPAVGWVSMKPKPGPYIKDMLEAAVFYTNRVLKDHKEGDRTHVEWARSLVELLNALHAFVMKVHTTGLVWNSAPGSAPTANGAPSATPAPSSGGPPPPPPGPPPPPPPPSAEFLSKPSEDKAGRDQLFQQLNQGSGITSKLKKVTADMQTHKNPGLRAGSTVPDKDNKGGASSAPAAKVVQKPPRIQLENGKQWMIENHKNDKAINVTVEDKKMTVYVYKCEGCMIKISGKANSITLDSCKKTAIAFDGVVAQLETINCQSVQVQTLGEMPTVSIQKTDGCQVYLSTSSRDAEIVTSKSSEMNVLVPKDDGDFQEFPVPEQFKTVYKGGKLETSVSDIC